MPQRRQSERSASRGKAVLQVILMTPLFALAALLLVVFWATVAGLHTGVQLQQWLLNGSHWRTVGHNPSGRQWRNLG